MLHMLAAFAEHEREQISQRVRAALKAAKARGVRLGNPRIETAWKAVQVATEARRPPAPVLAQVAGWRHDGATLREIGRRLLALGVRPPRGGPVWCLDSLRRLVALAA
jgi:DNA invertase Pin-like site-specific DNA recombinase